LAEKLVTIMERIADSGREQSVRCGAQRYNTSWIASPGCDGNGTVAINELILGV
jgi:hypothetical protein